MAEQYDEVNEPLYEEKGEPVGMESTPPPEPVRKGVTGFTVGSGALLILWSAQQLGVPMQMEVALALAGLLGAATAYFKNENPFR